MTTATRKRARSASSSSYDGSNTSIKRTRGSMQSAAVEDDDDDLAAVLEKIRQLEESEQLAKQLQVEFQSQESASAHGQSRDMNANAGGSSQDIIYINSDDDEVVILSESPAMGKGKATARDRNTRGGQSSTLPPSTPDEQLATFRKKVSSQYPCSLCGKSMKPMRRLIAFSQAIPPPGLLSALHISCASCKATHCRGCLSLVSCPPSCKGKLKNEGCVVSQCCKEVRALAIFEALGALDRGYQGEKDRATSLALPPGSGRAKGKGRQASKSVGPGGTGYSMDQLGTSSSRSLEVASLQAADWDDFVIKAIRTIALYLPKPYSEEAQEYDFIPDENLPALLSLSLLPELLTDLLRNDSVTDWIARAPVYEATLGLLRNLCDCELTLPVLTGRLYEKKDSCGIQDWFWHNGEITWQKDASKKISRNPPLYTHFTKLLKQAEAFLAGAETLMDTDDDASIESTIKATSLCGDIVAARDDIQRALTTLGHDLSNLDTAQNDEAASSNSKAKGKGKAQATATEALDREYARFCEGLAFEHVSFVDGPSGRQYNYLQSLTQTQSSTRNPKDRLHLLQELAVMATSLPPGIWVRVDEVRNDAIKIMIAGPEGTPYASGLFEFDCFMPLRYPHEPPQMHLRTTGNGTVRFNPNLYNNGKVCLSLLGTWHGGPEEQWRPGQSTLLQVLVSIQSMIFVDLPYFNEPGHGQAKRTAASTAYNRRIWLQTIRWAMVDWMRNSHKEGLWADVIAGHFKIREGIIRQTIEDWAREEPAIRGGRSGQRDLLADFDQGIARIAEW